ncbi:uncharacterized protein LOC144129867 [Amblyomma americanum]
MYCVSVCDLPSHDQLVKGVFRGNSVVGISGCSFPLHPAASAQPSPLNAKEVSRLSKLNGKRRILSPWCKQKRNDDAAILFRDFNVPFLNERALRERYGAAPKDLQCWYRELLLPNNASESRAQGAQQPDFFLGDDRKLVFGEPLHSDFVRVSCWFLGFRTPLFVDYFAVPRRKKEKTLTAQVNEYHMLDAEEEAHSVLVVTLGPTSSSVFSLRLPQTRSYLHSTLGAQQLVGYNRIGKGSLANQIPLISGFSAEGVERMLKDRGSLDDISHLWSHYKRRNFTTLFLEQTGVGRSSTLFTQERRLGFATTPADYYVRPFAAALNRASNLSTFCDRSDHNIRALLDYVRDVFKLNADRRLFAYISLEGVSHSSDAKAAALDKALQEFLAALHADGVFNKTFLFFAGDDGWSRESLMQRPLMSEIERYEANAPVCFVALPEWFARSYPEVIVPFELNRHRLVTPYDLHVTLLSLANPRPTEAVKTHKPGSNLFHEQPASRTCDEAFVPLQFCSCLEGEISTNTAWKEVGALARFSVDYINRMLPDDLQDVCVSWELRDVEEAKTLAGSTPSKMLFRIVFTTTPESRFEVHGRVFNTDTEPKRQSVDTVRKLDGPIGDCLSNTTDTMRGQFCACRQSGSSLGMP